MERILLSGLRRAVGGVPFRHCVVETDVGHVRVLEHGSTVAHVAGEPVSLRFSPDDSLVFDTATEGLVTGARVHPPA
jgi:inositol-phosphate transport system ATP-binding protein